MIMKAESLSFQCIDCGHYEDEVDFDEFAN